MLPLRCERLHWTYEGRVSNHGDQIKEMKTPEMPTFPSDSPDCHGLRDAKGLHRDGPSRCKPPCRPNRYNHDLDSRETEYRTHRPGPAEMVKVSRASNKQGQLNPRYERLARHLRAQQEQQPKANKNRRRASRSAEKQVGYKLPQIVVVQEPTHGRRVGGL